MHSASFNTRAQKITAEPASSHKQYHHDGHSCVSDLLNTSMMFLPFHTYGWISILMDGFPYSYYIFKDALTKVRTFLSGTYLFVSYSYNDTYNKKL